MVRGPKDLSTYDIDVLLMQKERRRLLPDSGWTAPKPAQRVSYLICKVHSPEMTRFQGMCTRHFIASSEDTHDKDM